MYNLNMKKNNLPVIHNNSGYRGGLLFGYHDTAVISGTIKSEYNFIEPKGLEEAAAIPAWVRSSSALVGCISWWIDRRSDGEQAGRKRSLL